jgi:hypothetical protein
METKVEEIWKDAVGYEGFYQISSIGRLKSIPRKRVLKERFIKTFPDKNGYMKTVIHRGSVAKINVILHRMVATAFIPNPDGLDQVNHKNGIKSDNRVENLEWCSGEYNQKHARDMGLHSCAKLNECDVLEIRKMLSMGKSHRYVSLLYNISTQQVSKISLRLRWRNI